jgi:D-3-phosphoglycerate dehydrogenase
MPARLTYFESWVDPVAERMLGAAPEVALQRLRFTDPRGDLDAAMAQAQGYQALPRTELQPPWLCDAALIARAPNLLAACSTGAGFDVIDVEACTAAGIIVCHQSGTNKEAVAEHTLGLMLALSKKMMPADRAMRREAGLDRYAMTGNDILGKTVGLIGIGAIGTRVAELCRGLFRMEVLACDPNLDAATIAARGARKVTMEELLARADFVSVHCPRDGATLGLIGAAEFARMKPGAFFIQTARGGIHDEAALAAALAEGHIAGAGVDVFLKEPPPPDHPLLAFDNVIATPHIAGITQEALHEMARAAAEQWIAIFRGEVPPRLVNPEAWPRYSARFARAFNRAPDPLP